MSGKAFQIGFVVANDDGGLKLGEDRESCKSKNLAFRQEGGGTSVDIDRLLPSFFLTGSQATFSAGAVISRMTAYCWPAFHFGFQRIGALSNLPLDIAPTRMRQPHSKPRNRVG